MSKRRLAAIVGLTILLMMAKVWWSAGEFTTLQPQSESRCREVKGMPGAEDITFHPSLGFAYVSSDDRRRTLAGRPVQGGIYRYDPRSDAAPVLLTASFKQPFHPHGISLFVDAEGQQTLYVINHPTLGAGQVEQFRVASDGLLQHVKSWRDPALVSPNDLVAVDAQRFYVSNDHGSAFGVGHMLEDFTALLFGAWAGRGNVLYFDGTRFRPVVEGTAYANGINLSRDGKTLYLAQILARSVSFYARDARTGALRRTRELALDTEPDNIELDGAGNLYMGAHPKAFAFMAHAIDRSGATRSPAQAIEINLQGSTPVVRELYLSHGAPVSGLATAAVNGDVMLLGPVFDPSLLRCTR